MSSISAIKYPTWDDLGRSVAEKLSRSVDSQGAKTQCSRTVHFLWFIHRYELRNVFLTDDRPITDLVLERYVNLLLDGFTINFESVAVVTIAGYMRAVNAYYKSLGLTEPWSKTSKTTAASLLESQSKVEEKPE